MNLNVWIRAKELAIKIYRITSSGKISNDFGFKDQIRRSAISIVSNIAEGDESGSDKLSIRYFYVAKGSNAELYTQLLIADEVGYITKDQIQELSDDCEAISAMLYNLIKSRRS